MQTFGYFICNGLHQAKDCSKKEKLNALIAVKENDNEPKALTWVDPF